MDCGLTSLDNHYRMINSLAPVTSFEDRFRFRTGSSQEVTAFRAATCSAPPVPRPSSSITKDLFNDLRICVDLSSQAFETRTPSRVGAGRILDPRPRWRLLVTAPLSNLRF